MIEKEEVAQNKDNNWQLLTRVAWLYYKQEMTQSEIAHKLKMPRLRVVRILQRARSEGIVQINIVNPLCNCLELEKRFIATFHLRDAMIVPSRDVQDENGIREALGKAAAQYLEKRLRSGDLLAVGWGMTTFQVAKSIRPGKVKNLRIVTLQGGLTPSYYLNPYEIGAKLAEIFQGECYYIHAPVLTASEELCRSFKSEVTVHQALEMVKQADYALVSIGKATPESTLVKMRYLSAPEVESLRQLEAVGDILVQFFDIEGRKVNSELHRRIIAFPIEELGKLRNVIGIAGGKSKIRPILGALRGGYIKVLITDEASATELLKMQEKVSR